MRQPWSERAAAHALARGGYRTPFAPGSLKSTDATAGGRIVKMVVELHDGLLIECVLIVKRDNISLCISSGPSLHDHVPTPD